MQRTADGTTRLRSRRLACSLPRRTRKAVVLPDRSVPRALLLDRRRALHGEAGRALFVGAVVRVPDADPHRVADVGDGACFRGAPGGVEGVREAVAAVQCRAAALVHGGVEYACEIAGAVVV